MPNKIRLDRINASLIHKEQDEVITGGKVFKSHLSEDRDIISGITIRSADLIRGTDPSDSRYLSIPFADSSHAEWGSDGQHGRFSLIETVVQPNGNILMQFVVYKNELGNTSSCNITLTYPKTGDPYITTITPATTDNSTKISTTAYVNNKLYAPVGSIVYYSGTGTPNYWLLCNGGAVSSSTYSTLYSVIGTKYGTGDGSTTFNLPNLTDRFPQGNGTPGTVKAAGLPNITGQIETYENNFSNASGALSTGGSTGNNAYHTDGGGKQVRYIYFKAASSNSIYGKSSTVQPPALTLRPIIRWG